MAVDRRGSSLAVAEPAVGNPSQPWDGFLIGPENTLAQAASVALARGEGTSPLVIHGPSGSGTTRLLEGLIAERLARFPGSAVALLTAEAFANLCAEAAGRIGGWLELRERFRRLDLLALDDLLALERAPLALAELAHTLDALDEAGASVAVAARSAPGQWSGLPARLASRLLGGLAVRVDPPGPDLRRRFVLERARARRLALPSAAVEALADSGDGFRALDGHLARLALEAKLGARSPGGDRVSELLLEGATTPAAALDRVVREVAARFGVSPRDLKSSRRHQGLVVPRHLAIQLARESTGLSFAAIGAAFGRRDAATIRHACRASAARLAADPSLAAVASALRRRWSSD